MTTRVFQDGEALRLGTLEEFAELWYDVSTNILRVQAPTSATSNTPVDIFDIAVAGTIYNEGGADRDFRAEGDTNINMIVLDAGLNALSFGGANVAGASFTLNNLSDRTQVTSVGLHLHVPAQTFNDSGGAATKAIFADGFWGIPTLTGTNAITYTDAASLYIAGPPVASTNITFTNTALSLWVDAGSVRFDGNLTLNLTLTAGADGVGADSEQLTSGGAGAECDWAAAGSLKEFKNLGAERLDYSEVLATLLATPVYDFHYKPKTKGMVNRPVTTGDTETLYTGVMADDAPWVMHHRGRIFNPANAFGYTVLGIKALAERVERLEAANA